MVNETKKKRNVDEDRVCEGKCLRDGLVAYSGIVKQNELP